MEVARSWWTGATDRRPGRGPGVRLCHRPGKKSPGTVLPVLLLVVCLGGFALAGEGGVGLLGHEDAYVRREAARALLAGGASSEAAVREAMNATDPSLAREAAKVARAFDLAGRLAESDPDGAAFWIALENAMRHAPPELQGEVLVLGLGDPARVAEVEQRRQRARVVAVEFLRDWNESYALDTDEKARYDALQRRLLAAGPAAVPHLLRVLEVDPRRTFAFVDPPPPGEVSARMQVRAVFGVSFLKPVEAVPYLVLHARGPSLTLASNADAALATLTGVGEVPSEPFRSPDVDVIDRWWRANRKTYGDATLELERALLEDLRTAVAREAVADRQVKASGTIPLRLPEEVFSGPARQAWLVNLLVLLSGDDALRFEPAAPPGDRVAQARQIASRLEGAGLR